MISIKRRDLTPPRFLVLADLDPKAANLGQGDRGRRAPRLRGPGGLVPGKLRKAKAAARRMTALDWAARLAEEQGRRTELGVEGKH
jgi:hypothetical protein